MSRNTRQANEAIRGTSIVGKMGLMIWDIEGRHMAMPTRMVTPTVSLEEQKKEQKEQ
jgi:hypothetical protein